VNASLHVKPSCGARVSGHGWRAPMIESRVVETRYLRCRSLLKRLVVHTTHAGVFQEPDDGDCCMSTMSARRVSHDSIRALLMVVGLK
jgi:hypothetical protein